MQLRAYREKVGGKKTMQPKRECSLKLFFTVAGRMAGGSPHTGRTSGITNGGCQAAKVPLTSQLYVRYLGRNFIPFGIGAFRKVRRRGYIVVWGNEKCAGRHRSDPEGMKLTRNHPKFSPSPGKIFISRAQRNNC